MGTGSRRAASRPSESCHRGRRAALVVAVLACLLASGLFVTGAMVPASARPATGTPPVSLATQAPLSPGNDYPTYLGNVERTSAASGEQLIEPNTTSALHELWGFNAQQPIQSQAVESNGTVYFGAKSGYEYALYANNGTFRWKTFLGQARNDTGCGNILGVTSTASVVGGTLYVDGGYPYFNALNASTGALEWRVPIGTGGSAEGFYQWSSPLIYNGRAYVGIASDCDKPLVKAGVDMYSLTTHSLLGFFDTSVPKANGSSIWGSPSIDPATNLLFVATGNQYRLVETKYSDSVIALNATTLQLANFWQIPVNEQRGDGDFGVTPTVFTPPGGYPMVAAANKNGILYALYQSNMSIAWQQPICCQTGAENEHISAAYGDGELYSVGAITSIGGVIYNSSVVAINPATGAYDWQVGFPGNAYYGYAAPLYVNHMLIVADQSSLMVLNATDGALLWETNVSGVIQAAPSIARGEVFVTTTGGYLYAYDTALNATDVDNTPVGATGLSQSFNVTVTGGLPPYAYSWNFGDGATATGATPSHTFATAGAYNVSVTVSDLGGTRSVTNSTVTVGPWSNVTFVETGLPNGTRWSVQLDRSTQSTIGASLTFNASNGSHSFQVFGAGPYSPSTPSGTVGVNGGPALVNVTFVPETGVTFDAVGWTAGTNWSVQFAGVRATETGSVAAFFALPGTYPYVVDPVDGYNVTPSTGVVTVAGAPVNVNLTFVPTNYTVTFDQAGLPSGTSWTVTLNGTARSSSTDLIEFSLPDGVYGYSVSPIVGYVTAPAHGNVRLHGGGTSETIEFVTVFSLEFRAIGLPAGTLWNVTVDTVTIASTNSTIQFFEPNGTYTYVVGVVSGWQTASTGAIRIDGGPRVVSRTFVPGGYLITFEESGLAPNTNWSVTINGSTVESAATELSFDLRNGNYTYTVGPVPGYTRTATGSISVQGGGFLVVVPFTQVRYQVLFKETGLPSPKSWNVTIGGMTVPTRTNSAAFLLPNGTYAFSIGPMAGYTTTTTGTVTVSDGPLTVAVRFTAIRYTVTFDEVGLAAPRSWSITIGGTTHTSKGLHVTFLLPDGSHQFTPATTAANVSSSNGTFVVAGSNLTVMVVFAAGGPAAPQLEAVTTFAEGAHPSTDARVERVARGG